MTWDGVSRGGLRLCFNLGHKESKVAESFSSVAIRKCVLFYPQHIADPQGLLTFIHARGFDDEWKSLRFTDEDLWMAQLIIQADPEGNPVVPGTGGLRKARFATSNKSGRRRACRIGYVYFPDGASILLLIAYAKNESASLSQNDKKFIRRMIEREHKVLSRNTVR